MKTGMKGIALIKKWETFVNKIYQCPAGLPTIGYGHVVLEGEKFPSQITEIEAHSLLEKDLEKFEEGINQLQLSLSQNQFDACISLAFNIGVRAFSHSTLVKKLRNNDYFGASNEFSRWNKATINGKLTELRGLTKRRSDETQLFREG